MKIGIVTLPFHINYGGILQAYALSRVLQREGHEVLFIKESMGVVNRLKNTVGLQIRFIICKISGKRLSIYEDYSKHNEIKRFVSQVLPQSINSKDAALFDAVIVGSDQVWRKWSPKWNIAHYFLDFINDKKTKKISYAASLGTDKWTLDDDETKIVNKLIKGFCGVSVRESDAISICQKFLKVTPEVVLDPTLLLSKQDYSEIGACEEKLNYIVSFILDNNYQKQEVSCKIGALLKQEVIALGPEMQAGLDAGKGLLGIEAWMKIYSQANFVITDSFHGSAFAINFNIPFVVLSNSTRGQSRLVSLLNTFNLSDRLIKDEKQVDNIIAKPIDWESVNNVISRLRGYSEDFLKRCLKK